MMTFFTTANGEDFKHKMMYVKTIDKTEYMGEVDFGNKEDNTEGLIILNFPVEIIRAIYGENVGFGMANPLYACDVDQLPLQKEHVLICQPMNDTYLDMYSDYMSWLASDEEDEETSEEKKKLLSNKIVNINEIRNINNKDEE